MNKEWFEELILSAVDELLMKGSRPMRDPDRIDVILDRIREIWKANPDLRLTQMLINVSPRNFTRPALYMWEDDALLEALKTYQTPSSSED